MLKNYKNYMKTIREQQFINVLGRTRKGPKKIRKYSKKDMTF